MLPNTLRPQTTKTLISSGSINFKTSRDQTGSPKILHSQNFRITHKLEMYNKKHLFQHIWPSKSHTGE